jgi:hypothetical protein
MRFKDNLISVLHLTIPGYTLSARSFQMIKRIHQLLAVEAMDEDASRHDRYGPTGINDVVFRHFLDSVIDVDSLIVQCDLFALFDTQRRNLIGLDEFYVLICILIAIRDKMVRPFFFANARTCFDLLDYENCGLITAKQKPFLCFVLNLSMNEIDKGFRQFEAGCGGKFGFEEFKEFGLWCLDDYASSLKMSDMIRLAPSTRKCLLF